MGEAVILREGRRRKAGRINQGWGSQKKGRINGAFTAIDSYPTTEMAKTQTGHVHSDDGGGGG